MKDIFEQWRAHLDEGQLEKGNMTPEQIRERLAGKTLIFFDVETTGTQAHRRSVMVTEIAGVAYDALSGNRLGEMNKKAELTDDVYEMIEWQKEKIANGEKIPGMSIEDILKMTAYYDGDTPIVSEAEMMQEFADFVHSFDNPILIAHNARFDMRMVGKAMERNGIKNRVYKYPVMDTLTLSRKYLVPLLKRLISLDTSDAEVVEVLSHIRPKRRFITNLGALGGAFKVEAKHWHSAISDTEQLADVLSELMSFLTNYQKY